MARPRKPPKSRKTFASPIEAWAKRVEADARARQLEPETRVPEEEEPLFPPPRVVPKRTVPGTTRTPTGRVTTTRAAAIPPPRAKPAGEGVSPLDVARGVARFVEREAPTLLPRVSISTSPRGVSARVERPGRVIGTTTGVAALGASAAPIIAASAAKQMIDIERSISPIPFHRLIPERQQQEIQRAGYTPEELVRSIPRLGLATAGTAYGLRHPRRAGGEAARETQDMLSGLSQLVGAMTAPDASLRTQYETGRQLWTQTLEDWEDRYGPDVPLAEVFRRGEEDPAITAANAITVAAPAVKGVAFATALAKTTTVGDALRVLRVPERPRTLTYQTPGARLPGGGRGRPGAAQEIPIRWSRSPLTRSVVNRPADAISWLAGRTPGVRHLPFSEQKRAARAKGKAMRRQWRRLPAEVRAEFASVTDLVGRFGNDDYRTALAVLTQKPKGFTDEEWIRASLADMRDMLEHPERFVGPEETVTPAIKRRLNQIKRLQRQEEAGRAQRLGRASRRVGREQARLSDALEGITARRAEIRGERREIADDDSLNDAEKTEANRELDAELRTLGHQAGVLRQELDEISITQAPVRHANREQAREVLQQIPYFAEDVARVDDQLRIGDARARVWGKQTGNDPGEWWGLHDFRLADAADIPTEARVFLQARAGMTPTQVAGYRRRFREFDPDDIRAYLDDEAENLGKKTGSGHPEQVRSRADLENLMSDLVRRMREGYPYSHSWYSESGKAIREFAGGDLERADTIAALFAIYSPQKPVAENLAMAFRTYHDWQLGRRPSIGDDTKKKLAEAVLKGDLNWLRLVKKDGQPKVRRFYANILKHIDPQLMRSKGFNGREVTADGWMGAAYGFGHNTGGVALGQPQIRFIERSTQALADHFGIEPEQAQAAIWTSIKAERDKTTAPRYLDEARREEALSEAGESFADSLFRPHYTLRLPFEAASGAKPWQEKLTPEQFEAYTAEVGDHVVQELRQEGFVSRLTDGGFGVYLNDAGDVETNPAAAVEIAIGDVRTTKWFGKTYGPTSKVPGRKLEEPTPFLYYKTRPDQRALYDGLAATIGDALDQETSVWARRFTLEHRSPNDATGWRVPVGRPLTQAEASALARVLDHDTYHATQHSDGFSIALNNPDTVLNRAVQIDRHKRMGRTAEQQRLRGTHETARTAHEDNIYRFIEATFADTPDTLNAVPVRYAHRGGYIARQDYEDRKRTSGRSDVLGRVGDRISAATAEIDRRYRADAAGAAADYAERRASARGVAARPLNQARRSDILGASQVLDGPEGRRIIYLTRNADASTVVHELVGHATDEMHRLYPEEFAAVETYVGKPYADWAVEDHERFATWAERYFDEGLSPTPELVAVFDRMKAWMRSVYEGMRRLLGEQLPPETRILFESYFGAYDDDNVARIAMNMGREGWGREDYRIQVYGGARVLAEQELKTTRKRTETRSYNQSLDAMVERYDQMTNRMDELRQKQQTWSAEEQDEWQKLSADILIQEAEIAVRVSKREQNLRKKIADLEKALTRGVDNRRFQGALEAMRWIARDREETLRKVFGADYDSIFENRRDLLADWLVARDLLQPDFESGTGYYFPHTLDEGFLKSVKEPAASLISRHVGKTQQHALGLHKRNQMILWQNGNWNADPAVLLEAHMRAMSYSWMNEVKQNLYGMARPLHRTEEQGNLPDNLYVINPNGTPLSPHLKTQLKPGRGRSASTTQSIHNVDDGLFGDNAKLETSLKNYWDSTVIDPKLMPDGFDLGEHPELRVLPKSVVHAMLRPVQGAQRGGQKAWDVSTTMARFALIYANVPGYMISNFVGNTVLLTLQQGWNLPKTIGRAGKLLRNSKLRALILAETGDLPAFAARNTRGRGFSLGQTLDDVEKGVLSFESTVDKYPRMTAWLYEAEKLGYRNEDDLFRLLRGADEKTWHDREVASEGATNHMIDFNRLTPWEQQYVARLLFIWPFIRGATAWPFWYGKNYPGRSALAATVALQAEERRKEMLGPTSQAYRDLFPISVKDGQAEVTRTRYTSPTSVLQENMKLAGDLYASLAGKEPDNNSSTLSSLFMPLLRGAIEVGTQRNDWGQEESLRSIAGETLFDMIPGKRLIETAFGWKETPRVFRKYDRGTTDRNLRLFVRVNPQQVSIPWLNAQAQSRGDKTTDEKIEENVAVSQKQWGKVSKDPYSGTVRRQVVMKTVFEDAKIEEARRKAGLPDFEPTESERGDWDVQYRLTKFEQAKIAYTVMEQYVPQWIEGRLKPPETMARSLNIEPDTVKGEKLGEAYLRVFDKLTRAEGRVGRGAEKVEEAERLKEEEAAAVG